MSNVTTFSRIVNFLDNQTYAAICGPLDQHISLIEHVADLSISRSGNQLLLQGNEQSVMHVEEILLHLIARQKEKGEIDEEDIKGALRFAGYEISSPKDKTIVKVQEEVIQTPRANILARSLNQASMIESLRSNSLTFGIGPAGTGKTFLAVAAAVEAYTRGDVERIILSRPAVEAGERIGFLPGDMKEKVDPYMQPLYDALQVTLTSRQLTKMYENKTIEIAPLAFMRGRTLTKAFAVLDEAQNASVAQMKMFLTRLGEGSKMAITGDQTQIDLPHHTSSGLMDAVRRLKSISSVDITEFTDQDVVRHPLVAAIIRAYQDAH